MKDLAIWVEPITDRIYLVFQDYSIMETTSYTRPIRQAYEVAKRIDIWLNGKDEYRIRLFHCGFGVVIEKEE